MVRSKIPSMRMNLALGKMMCQKRRHHDRRSIWAASNSACGTEPKAAKVIRIIKGVHIHTSTANTDAKAHCRLPIKSMLTPKKPKK